MSQVIGSAKRIEALTVFKRTVFKLQMVLTKKTFIFRLPTKDIMEGSLPKCQNSGKITATTYIVHSRGGLAYTLGEIIGVTGTSTKLADQGAANPTFAPSGWR